MLEKITVDFKLEVGDQAASKDGTVKGTIIRRWLSVTPLESEGIILIKKSYTVKPEKRQQVKLVEDLLSKVGEDGIAF